MNKFTLIVNAGRSGSSYVYNILKKNYGDSCFVFHESLLTCVTKPKEFNRAYTPAQIEKALLEPELKARLEYFSNLLKERPVIECGWTFSHLCPVLLHYFKDQFQVVVMYRNPIHFAASRATMGNYHSDSFYKDKSHEIAPSDAYTLYPNYTPAWAGMNPFEKSLFWWLESVSESIEFAQKHPEVPKMITTSETMFNNTTLIKQLIAFIGLPIIETLNIDQNKNPLHPWTYESFPLKQDWEKWDKHTQVIAFAKSIGYTFDKDEIARQMIKYQVPNQFLPKVRSFCNYWKVKNKIKNILK
jgi:hypothetical protein